MKKITLLIAFLMLGVFGTFAQSASSYVFSSSSGAYTENSGTATAIAGVRADTFISTVQSIGFNFVYEGTTYTQFRMSSNGFISLNATAASLTTNDFSAANAASRPIIAPLWDDLDGSGPATSLASYEVTGVAPNRVLTVEWKNWEWNYASATPVISFQAKLYETTNEIEFVYRQESTAVSTGSASIGIGSATGTGAGSYLNLTSVTVPAVSSTVSTTNINAKPATGQIFKFAPPLACTGTPVAGTVTPLVQNLCTGATPASFAGSGYSAAAGLTFQWEESNDDGSSDAWANAVGGTGATTASYTPPAFTGTTIYYRLKVTCTNSTLSAQTASVMVAPPASPSTQATAVVIPAATIAGSQAVVNWTNGNGARRVVYISDSATFVDPVNGNAPALTANNVYTGSGQQIIYDGTAATVSVRGLAANTQYYIKVYEYARCGAGPYDYYYNVTTGTNIGNFTTCAGTAVLPWTENFDGLATVGTTNFPSCWVKENGDWATAIVSTYNTPNSGANYLRDSWSATNEYMWTQGFTLTAGTSYDFSTFVQGDGGTGWVLDFYVNSTQNSAGATQIGATYNVPGTGTIAVQPYAQVTRTFVPASTGVYYFGMRVNQPSSSPWYVAFDDFELKLSPTIPPACAANLVATANNCGNFANTLTWDATPAANGYYITIGSTPGGTDIANNVNVGTTSYSFSGTINTQYFWTVKPYNGAGSAIGCVEQSFTTSSNGCYCVSIPTSNSAQGISNVQVGTTDFPTTDVTYFDHTSTVVDLPQGINANLQITFATGVTYDANVWIDFNDNYVFEASEQVFDGVSLAPNPTTLNASFVMPGTAALGQHMMRIGTADTGQATPNPCYSGTLGVTLDFAVNVVAAACVPPTVTSSITPDCANTQYYVDVNVTAVGDGSPYVSDGIDAWPVFGTGITQAGPFANGASVTLTLFHGTDATCDLPLGTFVYRCPPANNECATAIALTVNPDFACGVVTAGTNVAATMSSQTDDGVGTPNNDVWFSFVATGAAHQISLTNVVAVVGTSVDMAMAVYNGNAGCGSLVYVGSSDPNTYSVTGLTAGVTYYVRVYGYSVAQTTFNICVGTPPPPPANDECAAAVALTVNADLLCGVVTAGTNVAATMSSQTDDGAGTPNNDVWFSFIATGASHQITLTNVVAVVGTSVDMVMNVYNGTAGCGSLVYVGTSDPNTYNVTGLTAGVTYYVRVYGYSVAQTTFNICVGTPLPPPPPPANDNCAAAVVLTPGSVFADNAVVGTNASATTEVGHPTPTCENLNFATNGKDVWYSVVVPTSGSITIETNNNSDAGMTDTGLEVYSGTCGALTVIECDTDDSADGNFSIISLAGRTSGETLLIRIWGYNTNVGSFRVSAYDASLSTGSFDINSFKAYPNPVKDILNLSYSSEISSVEVYNLLGQVVVTKKLNTTQGQIDMSGLTAGSYIVKVTSNGMTKSMKVLKK